MEFAGSSMNESCISQETNRTGRLGGRNVEYYDTREYKSKNLHAERRRRRKLSDRLLALRSLMNKATIIEDAITYINELQQNVKLLSDHLLEMEASSEEAIQTRRDEINGAEEEMKKYGIMEEVEVTNIDGHKLWIKIILEKKRGRFSRLMEAMTYLGLELIDTNVTTSKGAMLISSCVEGSYGDTHRAEQIKVLLLDIIRSI